MFSGHVPHPQLPPSKAIPYHLLGIRVLDHVIFGETDYFSFADAGLLTENLNPLA